MIGARDAESLTLADLERVKAAVKRRGAETHAQKVAGVVKALFGWARRKRLIASNPATELEAAPSKIRERVYSDDELRAIWKAAEDAGIVGALVRLLLLTGVRREDATSARWSDFILPVREWTIPRTKTGRPHVVGLSQGALRVLATIPGDPRTDARLFPTTGKLGYMHDPDTAVFKAVVSDFRLHDLRRTVRSRLPELGVTPDIAERVLAHSLGGTIRRTYDHFDYAPAVAEALAKWDAKLARILS
jgi:integrase